MRKGHIAVGVAAAIFSAVIAGGGILFAFGGRLATIETSGVNAKEIADNANFKANEALLQMATIKNDISWIKASLEDNGFRPAKNSK